MRKLRAENENRNSRAKQVNENLVQKIEEFEVYWKGKKKEIQVGSENSIIGKFV